ncbi:MAG: 2,3-diaminopropionate biosynthesis protein SbnA [Chloroflexi bacterium]|nr:2,3-diaminopropionate biosynthesis protein SbnA [Chloroflexota bacterium]
MKDGILTTIGNTPLVELSRLVAERNIRLFAKLEGFNPGGSIKDRTAYNILHHALQSGTIAPGTTIIESSSGNMGIGLAQVCAFLKLPFICVVDPKTTAQNVAILKAYHAMVDMVMEPDPATGEFLQARINRVQELLATIPNSWCPNQYANLFNPQAHHQTMQEILSELDNQLDYLFCAVSTFGTLRGCAEYLREQGVPAQVVAVDAVGSVIFGQAPQKRLIPGHGAARRPALFQPDIAAECIHVTDLDCVVGCHQLLLHEAILAGGSSGAVIAAFQQKLATIPDGATCVLILADRGERYLDTIYSEEWVSEHFGDVSHLWQSPESTCTPDTSALVEPFRH